MGDSARRLVVLVVVVAGIAAGSVVARLTSDTGARSIAAASGSAPLGVTPGAGASEISADDVETAAWYCVSAEPPTLVVSSMSNKPVQATITRNSVGGSKTVTVPAGGQIGVAPVPGEKGPQAETVIARGGGIAASQTFKGRGGSTVSQCASRTSAAWYFPQGSTVAGNSVTLDVYNPSVTPAVVDVDLFTSSGEAQPQSYQGISVGSGQVVTESLDAHATGDANVATLVEAVSGSVVAEELATFGAASTRGYSDQLGAPLPATTWAFPYCVAPRRGSLALDVLNPDRKVADVTIEASSGAGDELRPASVTVDPLSAATVSFGTLPGVYAGSPYEVLVRSTAPVVVGRVVELPKAKKPNSGANIGIAVGSTDLLVPAAPAPLSVAYIALEALGKRPVTVTIVRASGSAAVPGRGDTSTLVPGSIGLVSKAVTSAYSGPWLVESTGPIAVEMDAAPAAAHGVVVIPGFWFP